MTSFVYCLTNTQNGKRYVGKANDPIFRLRTHLRCAKNGRVGHLSAAIRKWGPEAFHLEILQRCESESAAFDAEVQWISRLKTNDPSLGYNMNEGGLGGGIPTPEVLAKLRRPRSEETRQRMRKPKSEEHRQKLSETKRGALNPQFGKPLTDEHRSNVSAALTGDKNGFFGKTHSPETRERMRMAQSSAETKRKVSEGVKAAWARRRAKA